MLKLKGWEVIGDIEEPTLVITKAKKINLDLPKFDGTNDPHAFINSYRVPMSTC